MKAWNRIAVAVLTCATLGTVATSEASAAVVPELDAGPLVLKKLGQFTDYTMAVAAADVNGRAVVAAEFARAQQGAVQTTVYSFSLPVSTVRISRNLDQATLDTRSGMGRFGRIRLTFKCRRRTPSDPRSPCTGSRRARAGTVAGSLDVRTTLGGVAAMSLPARIALKTVSSAQPGVSPGGATPGIGRPSCGQYPRAAVLAMLPGASPGRKFALGAFLAARPGSGPMQLLAFLSRHSPPATETVALDASAPRSALTLEGTRAARFRASGIPFLQGSVGFSRAAPLPGCTRRAALGTVRGSLRARFDFFGTVSLLTTSRSAAAILIGPGPR